MATPTSQAQTAIDKLKQAGLKRSEFSVRTELHHYTDKQTGKRCYEYGDAIVSLKCSKARALELAEAISDTGLYVELVTLRSGEQGYPHISTTNKSGLFMRDFREDTSGWGKVVKVK